MVFYDDAGAQKAVRARTDFALVNLPEVNQVGRRPLELEMRLAEMTSFFSVFSFHMPLAALASAASIDAALAAGTKDFCLIQNAGHIFYGYDRLSFALHEALEACGLITGNVQSGGTVDPNCLLINRRAWEALGRPSFAATPASVTLPPGQTAQPWSDAIARSCMTVRTKGDVFAWLAALDDVTVTPSGSGPDPAMDAALAFLRNAPDKEGAPKKIFVFNSESDADFPHLRYRPGIDCAFVLASGFKANRLLETLGFHDATSVVHYDYSAPALMLRRAMVETWDGRDFAAFFMAMRPRIDAAFPAGVGYLPGPLLKDKAAVEREFQREVASVFTSEAQWLAHWARYRKLAHAYVETDVIKDRTAAKSMIAAHARGNTVLWMSDMFNSPNAVGKFSWQRRRQAFEVIADALKAHASSDLILGGQPALWVRAR